MARTNQFIIVSDSHGNQEGLARVLQAHPKADALLFLGDGLSDLAAVRQTTRCPLVYEVRGNCDYDRSVPADRLISLGGLRLFVTHGDGYEVKLTTGPLRRAAAQRGAEAVLFGHTHSPCCFQEPDGLWVLTPGSARSTFGLVLPEGEALSCSLLDMP